MSKKKLGSVKHTDEVVITSCDLANDVSGTLAVTSGGTGQTTYTNGQLLIGNTTGNTLAKATLTQGSNMSITNGSGAITLAVSDTPSFSTITQTKTDSSSTSGTQIGVSTEYITSPSSDHTGSIVGIDNAVRNEKSSGTAAALYSIKALAQNASSGTTTTNAYGVYSLISNSVGTTTTGTSFLASALVLSGSIGTYYGLKVTAGGTPSTVYGIASEIMSGSNKWNLYISGDANNAILGNVRIGSTTAPTNALDVTGNATVSGTFTVGGSAVLTASSIGSTVQAYDADLATIAGLTATTDNFIQSKSSAWASRTPTQVTADLIAMVGDSGSGGTKGLVPAPASGDAAAGKFLKADGTWTAPSGITLGTPVASTSGTSINFTSIPSGVKRITINFAGVSTNGTSLLLVQIGDSGGIETSGYISGATNDNGTRTTSTAGFVVMSAGSAAYVISGRVVLELLDAANFTWTSAGQLCETSSGLDGESAGSKSLSAELDRVRITTVGGTNTFDAGAINITYES